MLEEAIFVKDLSNPTQAVRCYSEGANRPARRGYRTKGEVMAHYLVAIHRPQQLRPVPTRAKPCNTSRLLLK
jgi:hypothetical protein